MRHSITTMVPALNESSKVCNHIAGCRKIKLLMKRTESATGMHICALRIDNFESVKKLVLMK
jgi:hypothetical protein